jgi:rhamnulokinase
MLDRKSHRWAAGLLSGLGIPDHFLSEIVAPGTVLAGLRPELKTSPELAATCVIAPACHDTGSAVAAIRTGEGVAFLSSGTWSLLGAEVQETVVNPESLRLNFTNEGSVGGAYRLLRNITGMWLLEECRRAWEAPGRPYPYSELLELAAKAEPLAFLMDPDDPAFSAPGDMPRAICEYAARTRQQAPQSPGAFTRAILESLALKYRFVLEKLAFITGRPFHDVRIIGGGCRNNILNQFVADATGCRVSAGPAEATALGNIAMQLVGLGAVASVAEARGLIERAFPPAKFEPGERGAWDRAYSHFLTLAPR